MRKTNLLLGVIFFSAAIFHVQAGIELLLKNWTRGPAHLTFVVEKTPPTHVIEPDIRSGGAGVEFFLTGDEDWVL